MTQIDRIYKNREEVLAEVLAAWAARIPDINVTPDTIVRIWSEVFSHSVEGLFIGMQLLHDDVFIQSASQLALVRHGEMYGRPQKTGTLSEGTVRFSGTGGELIPQGSQVGSPRPALGDSLIFETTDDATIPNPGVPTAPTVADDGAGSLPAGTYEYAVTFVTAEGETALGEVSDPVVIAINHNIEVTDIPLGGPGTVARSLYRRVDGGAWTKITDAAIVSALNDNVTTSVVDDATTLGGLPPEESTAERVTVTAQSTEAGVAYNVAPGAITEIVNVEADVNEVTNASAFTGGSDPESVEEFRSLLLEWVRAPQSGSPADLIAWATSIEGVETASVFKNVDLSGDPSPGTVVVRISGPDGSVPDNDKVAEVLAYLESKDLANIEILVGTFTPVTVTVEVTVEIVSGFTLAEIEDTIKQAAIDYVNAVPVAGTVYVAGLYHAIFALPGVVTLTVDLPAADVTTAADEKAIATLGDVTVNEAP